MLPKSALVMPWFTIVKSTLSSQARNAPVFRRYWCAASTWSSMILPGMGGAMASSPLLWVPVAVVTNMDSPLVMLRPMALSTPPRPFFLVLRPPVISTPREYTMLPLSVRTDSPCASAMRAMGQSESPVSTNFMCAPFSMA